jgi:hypothetical protein
MADGLLTQGLNYIDRQKQNLSSRFGLLVNNPEEFARKILEETRQRAGVGLLGEPKTADEILSGKWINTPYGQNAIDQSSGFAGTITAGPSWMGKKVPSVEKLAKNQGKFLYHSDTAKNLENLKYGIDPQQGGNWVKEIAQGATDDVEGLLANQTPMSWFSDKPEWVKIKVARELNKPLNEVTINDIKKHGHLAIINKKDPYLKDIWKVGETGLSEGGYSKVENLKGEKIPAYQTNMYQEGNYGQKMEPFGVERNEWVSTQSVEPLLQLTGDNLVKYLQLTGILKK